MSHATPAPGEPADPSMEDILASIRRILNDGEPETASPPEPAEDDDVFLLDQTMMIEEPAPMESEAAKKSEVETASAHPHGASDAARASFAPHQASPDAEEPVPPPSAPPEPLLASATAAAASASLGALVRVVGQRQMQLYRGGPTLEDMVRDEIRPIMKEWLDENLAPMVERMVRVEIERVTRNL